MQTTGNIQGEEGKIRLCQKTSQKSLLNCGIRLFGRMKPRLFYIRTIGKEKSGERNEEIMIQTTPHHTLQHVWLPMKQTHWRLLMMWLLTSVSDWILKCKGLEASHVQPTTTKLIGWCFKVRMDNNHVQQGESHPTVFQDNEMKYCSTVMSATWSMHNTAAFQLP